MEYFNYRPLNQVSNIRSTQVSDLLSDSSPEARHSYNGRSIGYTDLYSTRPITTVAQSDWVHRISWNVISGAPIMGIDSTLVIQVPEPATWAMMIGGFGMVGAAVRRRATRVAATG